MLDEPPLMVRTHALACFTEDTSTILQPPEKNARHDDFEIEFSFWLMVTSHGNNRR